MTSAWPLLLEKRAEIAPALRREFWLPLRRLAKIFHILPVAAAAALFVLLAFDGQLTEIYVSYMEDIASAGTATVVVRFVAAAFGFTLISAVLYEAHYRLSGPRIGIIYSMNAEVGTGSRLRQVQDVSAIVIALSPWFGIVAGLLNAKLSLAHLFKTLQKAKIDPADLQHVPEPSVWAVACAIAILGMVAASLVALHPKNRTLQRSVMMLTPLAAALMFRLLVDAPPLDSTAFRLGASLAAIVIIGGYYVVYHRIELLRAYIFRAKVLREDNNFSMRQWQRIVLFGWALLPWIVALVLYLLLPAFGALKSWLLGATATSENGAPLPSLAMIPVSICWVAAIGLAVASSLHRLRDRFTARAWLYVVVCALAGTGLLMFWLASTDFIVTVYRCLGPLGSLALSLLFLISGCVVLAVLSQRSHFPAFTIVILALIAAALLPMGSGWATLLIAAVCLVLVVVAVLSRLWPAAGVALVLFAAVLFNYFRGGEPAFELNRQAAAANLGQQFDDWLTSKGVPAAGGTPAQLSTDSCFAAPTADTRDGQKYPVFIIAVEGGGIYAASAASMFLARLQDENPCFSDHVFAISAVSGGALGATIFQAIEAARLSEAAAAGIQPALLAERANATETALMLMPDRLRRCRPPPAAGSRIGVNFLLERKVCRIVQGDHFSPLIASIFPELLGFTRKGRPFELAAGFQQSAKAEDSGAAAMLRAPFTADWSDVSKAPALVLNATWVETGLRAAFAPFPLHSIDDSLYSFLDAGMPANPAEALIDAAVVSARFPLVLPPYSISVNAPAAPDSTTGSVPAGRSPPEPSHWNFVDGAYSDNSGAATALALYRALFATAQSRRVALRLILLTSSDPELAVNQISGTTFAEVMGPLNAMLNVRSGLANEAVARACDGVLIGSQGANADSAAKTQNTCEDRANQPNSALQIVGIEDQTYGLSLGWKISQTTFSVVSWMLGRSDMVGAADCNGATEHVATTAQANGQFILNEQVVKRNSCVLWAIQQSLGGAPAAHIAPERAAPAQQR